MIELNVYILCTVGSELHVYDGFVFPKTKQQNTMSSKDSYGHALYIFLKAVRICESYFNVSQIFEPVCNIYFQLKQKKYLLGSDEKKCRDFCCIDLLNVGLQKVCIIVLYTRTHLHTQDCFKVVTTLFQPCNHFVIEIVTDLLQLLN